MLRNNEILSLQIIGRFRFSWHNVLVACATSKQAKDAKVAIKDELLYLCTKRVECYYYTIIFESITIPQRSILPIIHYTTDNVYMSRSHLTVVWALSTAINSFHNLN